MKCEVCKGFLVQPSGPEDSPFLLVGAYPGWEEMKKGIPWVGNAGKVLKSELRLAGLAYEECRVTNLWLHNEVKESHDAYSEEFTWHSKMLQEEMKGRKGILLMGRQPILRLTGQAITDVESLNIKRMGKFPKSVEFVIASRNPAQALIDGAVVGNVRHAIQRFVDMARSVK